MRWKQVVMVGTVLAVASTAAVAFQEQRQIQGPPAALPQAPAGASPGLKLEGDVTTAPAARPTGGTEVRIPGLGKLGILPRIDFGLDLLYGAADPQRQATTPSDKPEESDGLTIRGSVKHKF